MRSAGARASFAPLCRGQPHPRRDDPLRRRRGAGFVERAKALFTPAFFAARAGAGCPAPDPIFILGMPRAGSTLVEQILASHPKVEGTRSCPTFRAGRRLAAAAGQRGAAYPECLAELDPADARGARRGISRAHPHPAQDRRPFFIDKMPNNWAHAGLIHLILPNAKIVDARRHPLDCCFSNFKQHFARGQGFTYRSTDMGRYYADYVRLMAHFDRVLPGPGPPRDPRKAGRRSRRRDPAAARLSRPAFDPACLAFHENARAVRTASSEQVRRPINRDGLDQWRPTSPGSTRSRRRSALCSMIGGDRERGNRSRSRAISFRLQKDFDAPSKAADSRARDAKGECIEPEARRFRPVRRRPCSAPAAPPSPRRRPAPRQPAPRPPPRRRMVT